jgi:hypothetical protein
MGLSTRPLIVLGTTALFSLGVTFAYANTADTVIAGCVQNGNDLIRFLKPGDSCNGHETPLSWSIAGPQGELGPQGPIGDVGPTGPTGASGPTGAGGAAGPAGPQGPTGSQGPTGDVGAIGLTGASGAPGPIGPTGGIGATGATGTAGPSGAQGAPGLSGVQLVTGETKPFPGLYFVIVVNVSCPAGKVALSGGATVTDPKGPVYSGYVVESWPTPLGTTGAPTGWTGSAWTPSIGVLTNTNVTAWAVCASAQ